MRTIRVLVVEDSLTARKRLVEVLTANPDIEVVGEAADGKRGIELCQQLRPNLVTLDMMLPVMSGLAATEYIMAYCPTPILIVSSSTNRGEVFKTYDALAAGAVDVLEKPRGDEADGAWESEFLAKVRLVSQIKVITHVRPRLTGTNRSFSPPPARPPRFRPDADGYQVVAIGTSTGGPAASIEILRNLPSDFPVPILLVIHIGSTFATFLADWLDSQSELPVSYAQDGMPLSQMAGGRVLMAPPDRHLVVCGGHLRLTGDPERHSCRPSVDALFESLAASMGRRTIACLLTGMGRDGAQGLLAVRHAGGRTLAQDQASSAVFGMPQEAIRLGAAQDILPLQEFAPTLVSLAVNAGKVQS
jgi:two-component system, chemotaxis family, protein-glutamate methylesterase/glutaminase